MTYGAIVDWGTAAATTLGTVGTKAARSPAAPSRSALGPNGWAQLLVHSVRHRSLFIVRFTLLGSFHEPENTARQSYLTVPRRFNALGAEDDPRMVLMQILKRSAHGFGFPRSREAVRPPNRA